MKNCRQDLTPLEQQVCDALRQVLDPEIGENIVDIGLVYGIAVVGHTVTVHLTMTTPACPVGEMLLDETHAALARTLSDDMEIDIHLVWDPPWTPDMMSAEAKQRLGWS